MKTLPISNAYSAPPARPTGLAEVILQVPNITCGHCAQTINQTLRAAPGIKDVRVDIPDRQVHVQYDASAVGIDAMAALLAAQDYPVSSAEELSLAASAGGQEAEPRRGGCACCA